MKTYSISTCPKAASKTGEYVPLGKRMWWTENRKVMYKFQNPRKINQLHISYQDNRPSFTDTVEGQFLLPLWNSDLL